MSSATLEDYKWLVSHESRAWLDLAAAPCPSLVSLAQSLRASLSAQRVHLVLEQAELRRRAREKFDDAERMFFRRRELEQATDQHVAAYKAERFHGLAPSADLCCGIGGDLLAMAAQGPVVGVDRDPATTLLAEANSRSTARENVEVLVGDACQTPVASFRAWHVDPDRRAAGQRTTSVHCGEPGAEAIDSLLKANANGAVKLAPAAAAPADWQATAELEWIGSRGECRQQVAWFGALARQPGRRTATVLSSRSPPRTVVGRPNQSIPVAAVVRRWLYEPHSAILAAGLVGAIAAQYDLAAISSGVAYLTGDNAVDDPALSGFEVLDVLPFDRKTLRRVVRQRGIGRLEVKTRGLSEDPRSICSALRAAGDQSGVLLLTRSGAKAIAILARRPS